MGARALDVCLLGAPNAGKSSLINLLVQRNVYAVSNKYNTTDEANVGVGTDPDTKTQVVLTDTPGVTKASDSMRSNLLVTKAWDCIQEQDMVLFVVDSAKRLSFEVKNAVTRLSKITRVIDPQERQIMDAIKDESVSDEKLKELIMTD